MEYIPKYTSINLMAWGSCIYKVKYLGPNGGLSDTKLIISRASLLCFIFLLQLSSPTVLSILIWLTITTVFHMVFGLLRSNFTKSQVYKLFKVFHFLHTATLIHQFNILMKKFYYNWILDSINLCKNFETSTWMFHNYNCKILYF
jgi:hypothetical protein